MAINPIEFGQNLRPSAITLIKKVNEVVNAVNNLDPAAIEELQSTVSGLVTKTDETNTRVAGIVTRVGNVESVNTAQQTDIDSIKVTLYTPLTDNE